ncbi:alpha-hydroxy-acid oxidizing protein [Aquibium sp. A9E412]|uniref:alpha-hydroxy-acid oxidizing protein n=1 Tax=Aquibium sp. A9E412 TaxID=2976767 RepID=UPI0025B1710F|nr:alpha-hydroxy-acid oxidizing protein [Aquibium sp. A9E412]MDN2566761.1 alpha-hydroxy-acid oxidizing protein [Aquibium sp. A9E412]
MSADRPAGEPGPGRLRQTEIFVTGAGGRRPAVPVDPRVLEEEARRRMTADAAAYVLGGAGSEATMAANRAAFERQRFVPRVLAGVGRRDLSVELFGRRHAAPLLLAPIGVLEMVAAEADRAVARAAAAEGVGMVFSNQASVAMEDCAAAMGAAPRWFQLYWSSDDACVRSLVGRAEACGCEALVLTLDTTLLGWRPRDLDRAYLPFLRGLGLAQYLSDPVFRQAVPEQAADSGFGPQGLRIVETALSLRRKGRAHGLTLGQMRAAVAHFVATYSRPDLAWSDIARLRAMTRLPIVLKGVRHPDDARLAREHGVDGLVVSNHGGRQVDGEIAALDALPAVVAAAGDLPVLFDSGIRSGADIAKALALGARAVLVGRPYVHGLAIAGETGVREVIRNLVAELDLTLALCGRASAAALDRSVLAPADAPAPRAGEQPPA